MNNDTKKSSSIITILLLIIFFPIGLYFLWSKTSWGKWIKIAITGFFIFIVLMALSTSTKVDSSTSAPTPSHLRPTVKKNNLPTSHPSMKPKSTLALTQPAPLESKIKNVLPNSLSSVTVTVDKALDFQTNKEIEGFKDVTIISDHNGNYWDVNDTKKSTLKEAVEIIKGVFVLDGSINSIIIVNKIPTTDVYGKKDSSTLNTIIISKATYKKIDFKNFNSDNIPLIADSYSENKTIK